MKKGIKHEHKMTNCLKAIIFSCLMLAPFIAIGVKCWYVANNKNALNSYRGEYKFEYLEQVKFSQWQANNYYTTSINFSNYDQNEFTTINNYMLDNSQTQGFRIKGNDFVLVTDAEIHYETGYTSITGFDEIRIGKDWNISQGFWRPADTNYEDVQINIMQNNIVIGTIYVKDKPTLNIQVNLTAVSYNLPIWNNYFGVTTIYTYVVDNTLSSVFYSAVDELDDASIFSWTTETAIYNAINNMCKKLGIVSPPLAVLLTYWTLLTIIYVIIDIVIETFIFLTHWLNDKKV